MTTSAKLTPQRYPRLVLLHADPMDVSLKRSFNFNKLLGCNGSMFGEAGTSGKQLRLRAFLFARALAGVGLDSEPPSAAYLRIDSLFPL